MKLLAMVESAPIIEPTRTIIMTILPKLPKSPPKMSIPPAKKIPTIETRRAVLPEKALTSLSRAVFQGKSLLLAKAAIGEQKRATRTMIARTVVLRSKSHIEKFLFIMQELLSLDKA